MSNSDVSMGDSISEYEQQNLRHIQKLESTNLHSATAVQSAEGF